MHTIELDKERGKIVFLSAEKVEIAEMNKTRHITRKEASNQLGVGCSAFLASAVVSKPI